jgi:hypothetical protein
MVISVKRSLAAILALALLLAASAAAGLDSGVRGTVTLGPTQPVCTVDAPCSRPYETTVGIRDLASGRLRRVRSDRDGRFRAGLRPGRYRLRAAGGRPFPSCDPITTRVRRHRFTRVDLSCDTGIR